MLTVFLVKLIDANKVEPSRFGYRLRELHTAMLRNHYFKCDPVIVDLVDFADP